MNIDWGLAIPIILSILLLVAGGYIKRLLKEIQLLLKAVSEAVEDGRVNDAEMARIIKRGGKVKDIILEIARLVNR